MIAISQRLAGDDHFLSRVDPGYNPVVPTAVGRCLDRSNEASTLRKSVSRSELDFHLMPLTA